MAADRAFIDIDEAFAEQDVRQHGPIVVRLCGRDWEVPGVVNSAVVLRISRWEAAGRGLEELSFAETVSLVGDVIPEATLVEWSKLGVGLDDPRLHHAVMSVMDEYARRLQASEREAAAGAKGAPGNWPAPAAGASSPTGPSSRPTSAASTSSTSRTS